MTRHDQIFRSNPTLGIPEKAAPIGPDEAFIIDSVSGEMRRAKASALPGGTVGRLAGLVLVTDYPTIADAITGIGADEVTLLIDTPVTLAADLIIPENVVLSFCRHTHIATNGFTLTINGDVDAGFWQVFDVSGGGSTQGFLRVRYIYPQWWGALADGAHDDTEAVQAAIDAACYDAAKSRTVYFIAGDYAVHEIFIPNGHHPLLVGEETANTRITYNGAGGPGSYVIRKSQATTGAFPWGGFMNLRISGYYAAGGLVAETVLHMSDNAIGGNAGIDWGFKLDNLHIHGGLYGIRLGNIVNCHINRPRFDSIGYDCIFVKGDNGTESRPMTINYGTWDNGAAAALATALRTAAGDIAAGAMGRTFVNMDNATGIQLSCRGWRFEMNLPLDTSVGNRPCLVRANKGLTNACSVKFDDLHGFANIDQGLVVAWCPDYPISLRISNSSLYWCRVALVQDGAAPIVCVPFAWDEDLVYQIPTAAGVRGMFLGRNYIGNAEADPNTLSGFAYRAPGDITSAGGTRYVAGGIGLGAQSALTFAAGVSVGIGATTVVCAASESRLIAIGLAIRIPGAGAAGADLDTIITDYDWDTRTITFADAVSTAVGPVDIVGIPLVWA